MELEGAARRPRRRRRSTLTSRGRVVQQARHHPGGQAGGLRDVLHCRRPDWVRTGRPVIDDQQLHRSMISSDGGGSDCRAMCRSVHVVEAVHGSRVGSTQSSPGARDGGVFSTPVRGVPLPWVRFRIFSYIVAIAPRALRTCMRMHSHSGRTYVWPWCASVLAWPRAHARRPWPW